MEQAERCHGDYPKEQMAAIALAYHNESINIAHMVDKGVIDVEEKQFLERLIVHPVPLVRYIGKGREGLRQMRDEIHAEDERVVIPFHVPRLRTMRVQGNTDGGGRSPHRQSSW
jgi:hypothetical protein